MFARVPADRGIPQVGSIYIDEGRSITDEEAVVCYMGEPQENWVTLTDVEYLAAWKAGKLSADKKTISADGLDTATVIAEVHPSLTEITFYHAETDEPIATVPVDPTTYTATLEVTATTPGAIWIRAGELTITRLNEVVIIAQ